MNANDPILLATERITNMLEKTLVPGWNSDPSGENSLSYTDTHDGFLYSRRIVIYLDVSILHLFRRLENEVSAIKTESIVSHLQALPSISIRVALVSANKKRIRSKQQVKAESNAYETSENAL